MAIEKPLSFGNKVVIAPCGNYIGGLVLPIDIFLADLIQSVIVTRQGARPLVAE